MCALDITVFPFFDALIHNQKSSRGSIGAMPNHAYRAYHSADDERLGEMIIQELLRGELMMINIPCVTMSRHFKNLR